MGSLKVPFGRQSTLVNVYFKDLTKNIPSVTKNIPIHVKLLYLDMDSTSFILIPAYFPCPEAAIFLLVGKTFKNIAGHDTDENHLSFFTSSSLSRRGLNFF